MFPGCCPAQLLGASGILRPASGPTESGPTGAVVRVLDPKPRLVLGHPLNEIELRRGEVVLWSQLASSKAPIRGPLAWPLPAMQAADRLELALRPQGAAGGDWAVVTLEAASAEAQQLYASAVSATASTPEQRSLCTTTPTSRSLR